MYTLDIMAETIHIEAGTNNRDHDEFIDICTFLASRYGSARNAAVQLGRSSPQYEEAQRKMAEARSQATKN